MEFAREDFVGDGRVAMWLSTAVAEANLTCDSLVKETCFMDENAKSLVSKLIEELTHQRDELRLKIHLGSLEAKEQLGKLEDQLFEMRQKFAPTKEAVDDSAEDVWDALKLLGSEIKDGFERIWKSL